MRIIIIGYGKMGHLVEQTALKLGFTIVHIIDKPSDWDELKLEHNDVVAIEFSEPSAAPDNIMKCAVLGIPVVCGTTAWLDRLSEIADIVNRNNSAMVYGSNFSVGVNVWFLILAKASAMFDRVKNYRIRMQETHHIHKLDAPSGTAIKAANVIIDNQSRYTKWELDGNDDKSLSISAIRMGDITGIHDVKFESDEDIIEIRHEAKNRQGFASGALMAAQWIQSKKGVFDFQEIFEEVLKLNNKKQELRF